MITTILCSSITFAGKMPSTNYSFSKPMIDQEKVRLDVDVLLSVSWIRYASDNFVSDATIPIFLVNPTCFLSLQLPKI